MQMDIQERQGQLVNVDDVAALISDVIGTFRNKISSIGASVTRDLALRASIDKVANDAIDSARISIEALAEAGFNDSASDVADEDSAA